MERKEREPHRRRDDHHEADCDLDPRRQPGLEQRIHIEAPAAGDRIQGEHADRQHARAQPPIAEQPPRGGRPSDRRATSPAEDEKRQRNRRRTPEEDEHEHVAGDDGAVDGSLGQQQQAEICPYPLAHAQRREHGRDADQPGQDQHHEPRAVDAEVVGDPDRRQPRKLLLVLHRREEVLELVVRDEEDEDEAQVGEERDLLHQHVVAAARVGHARDRDGDDDRDPDQQAEQDR